MEYGVGRAIRGDSPSGADNLYDHIEPLGVRVDYCAYMPRLCD